MDERAIRNASIILSIAGLALLFYVSDKIEPAGLAIADMSIDDVGKSVKVCGTVKAVRATKDRHVFFTLDDGTGETRFVVFNSSVRKLNESGVNIYSFRNGDSICATGLVQEYPKASGELELVYRRGTIVKEE